MYLALCSNCGLLGSEEKFDNCPQCGITIVDGTVQKLGEKPLASIVYNTDTQKPEEPSYKKLWDAWPDSVKADFLEAFYKEQAEFGIRNPHLAPGKYILDKTKYRLLPIKETETESTVEYKVVEK